MSYASSKDFDMHPQSNQNLNFVLSGKLRTQYFSCIQWRLWSDWVDALADRCLRWAHKSIVFIVCAFVTVKCLKSIVNFIIKIDQIA